MSQRREKKLRQLERRVSALEAKTAKENPGVYYWAETTENERNAEAERMRRPESGCRLAMGIGGSVGGDGILQRIVGFFRGR